MGFKEALQNAPGNLTDADRRIGAILLDDLQSAPFHTASQLASKANVHDSTVVRFAQKLGYRGYLAMRLDLASDSLNNSNLTAQRQPDPLKEASLERVVRGQIEVLEKVVANVDQKTIDDAMRAVSETERVYIAANGLLGPIADFFSRKIALLGIPSIVVHDTGTELAHRLAMVRPSDVVIFYFLSTDYDSFRVLEEELVAQGTTVVLVTDEPTLTFQPKAQHVLAVPRSELKHGVFVVLATMCYAMDYSLMLQIRDSDVEDS